MAKRGRKPLLETQPELKAKLIAALERGLTDEMAYLEAGISKDTFYREIKKNGEFCEDVTRARAVANTKAVAAFSSGLEKQKTNQVEVSEFEETRLNRKGEPYTYVKRTTVKKAIETAPDWRAGEAWLKRRDAANWSDKLLIEINPQQLETLAALLKQHGLKASDLFDDMIKQLADTHST